MRGTIIIHIEDFYRSSQSCDLGDFVEESVEQRNTQRRASGGTTPEGSGGDLSGLEGLKLLEGSKMVW